MELLAPAGSVEHFTAALEAGADAVYVGAPFLNARNPSRELRFEEIGAMVHHARSLDRRVYVALNSLIREEDLPRLVETLAWLEAINPHALIIQDLAVIDLVRRYFSTLKLHASTLMFAHSSIDVEQLAGLGCSRVVLARELTLKEIAAVVRASPVEIEVFVHGAMCFSYSGRCLFSSFHGGKSGLRGNCVQPCRRKFSIGSRAGNGSGYIFSMNDLEGIDFIDDFKRIGVAAIKIEGRLKPVAYVQHVVEAYRTVLDADGPNRAAAMTHARELLDTSLGRRRSGGYFLSPSPRDAIVSSHSGNIGTHLGTMSGFAREGSEVWGILKAKTHCHEGDRLRLHFDRSGERTAFTARRVELRDDGKTAVLLPDNVSAKQLQGKIDIYRVDTARKGSSGAVAAVEPLSIQPFSTRDTETVRTRSKMVSRTVTVSGDRLKAAPAGGRRQPSSAELWVRFDTVKPVYQKLPFSVDRFVLPVDKKTLSETGQLSRYFGKSRNRVIWALPPVVHTHRSAALRREVQALIRSGFRSFQISTLGQLSLFDDRNVSLFGDFSLNILNSRSMILLTERGLTGFQFSIETDRKALKMAIDGYRTLMGQGDSGRTVNRRRSGLVGLTVYGAPPLFMSRMSVQNVSFNQHITSPKQERFVIQKTGGESLTRPVKPFSLLPYRKELQSFGVDYMVIDLSGMASGNKALEELARRIDAKERAKKMPSFNFDGTLE